MKLKEWHNRLGYDWRTGKGEWDIWKPTAQQPMFAANYFPNGERQATRRGLGETPDAAVANAERVEQ